MILEDIHFVTKVGKLVVYGVYGGNYIFKEETTVLGSFSQTCKFPAAIDYFGKFINTLYCGSTDGRTG